MKTVVLLIALIAAHLIIVDRTAAQTITPSTQPATRPVATLITLKADNRPVREVLQEIARQAKVTLSIPKDLWATDMPTVTLDAVDRTFWDVLRDLCRQAQVAIDTSSRPGVLSIISSDGKETSLENAGPLLLRVMSITLTRRIDYTSSDARIVQPTINLQVACEPSMRILRSSSSEQVALVVDGRNITVHSARPREVSYRGDSITPANCIWNVTVPIPELPAQSKRVDLIRFNIRAILQTRMETWELDDLKRQKTHEIAGWTLEFKKKTSVNEMVESVEVAITRRPRDLPGTLEPFNGLRLLDKDDMLLMQAGTSGSSGQNQRTIQFMRRTNNGQPTGEPVKLQWDVPAGIETISIPFELKNIELNPK